MIEGRRASGTALLLAGALALACGGTAEEPPRPVRPAPVVVAPPAPAPAEPAPVKKAVKASDVAVPPVDAVPTEAPTEVAPPPPQVVTVTEVPATPVAADDQGVSDGSAPEDRMVVVPAGVATITAPPSDPQAAKVVERFVGQLRGCYEAELARVPDEVNTISLLFTVEGGRVTQASIGTSDHAPSASFGGCLIGRAKRWSFPLDVTGPQRVSIRFTIP